MRVPGFFRRKGNGKNPYGSLLFFLPVSCTSVVAVFLLVLLCIFCFDFSFAEKAREISPDIKEAAAVITGILAFSVWDVILPFLILFSFGLADSLFVFSSRNRLRLAVIGGYAGLFLATLLASAFLTFFLKIAFGRPRPGFLSGNDVTTFFYLADAETFSGIVDIFHLPFSFPSGHAVIAACKVFFFCLLFPFWRFFFLFVLFCISLSRIILEEHYPSDVIFGVWLGSVTTLFFARIWSVYYRGFRISGEGKIICESRLLRRFRCYL